MAEKRGWKRYERSWRAYGRFREDGVELFLKEAKDVVWSMLKLYREDREEFDKHYHQMSRGLNPYTQY